MQTLIKHLSKRNTIVIALAVTLLIAYLSLGNLGGVAVPFSISDKVAHAIAYFTLTISWLLVLFKLKNQQQYIVITSCIVYGILLEILQGTLTTYRTFDLADAVANTIGVFIGLLIFNKIFKKSSAI